ncbi:phage baseplate assembly protein V [Yersinia enterocolitica]|uniref:phage baseplate assembly protein V n=1 Tax=Yersinia enterocolitica TaxID=630 RepID=UPI003F43FBF4
MPSLQDTGFGTLDSLLEAAQDSSSARMRVCLPGVVQSFDPDEVTCVVQLSVNGSVNGNSVKLPLLEDLPVVFPRGGGVTLTFPVSAGDECLVVFSDRCIDFWHQSGGFQEPVDDRMHDLSDAVAIVGLQSQATRISNISTSAAQLRSDDGAAFIELEPASHAVTVTTSGKLTATAEEITVNGPTIFNGPVTFNGPITQTQGNGDASFGGSINASGDVKSGNISLQTHVHSGVQTGGGNTGEPK